MSTVRSTLRTIGAATAAGALLAAASPSASSASAASSAADDIPILGQAMTQGIVESGPPAVITVHGVRRVEGATIVYWSLGIPQDTAATFSSSYLGPSTVSFGAQPTGSLQGDVALTDGLGGRTFRPLQPGDRFDPCVCGPSTTMTDISRGQAQVIWSAVAPLPADVTSVDVTVAEQLIPDIPVEEGPLLPLAAVQEDPLILGMGWPEIDAELVAEAVTPEVYTLTKRVSNLEQSVTTSEGEVSLASDVLFAKDSATLTAKGTRTVADAAAQIKATNGGKALTVTGHADSDASDAYNLALSQKRAKAVATALSKALGGGYTITTVGKGESEPIASNKTDAGKAKNRRVSITYAGGQ